MPERICSMPNKPTKYLNTLIFFFTELLYWELEFGLSRVQSLRLIQVISKRL